jgi:hypothetical protein
MTRSLTLSGCALIRHQSNALHPDQVRLTRAARKATARRRDNGPLSLAQAIAFVPLALDADVLIQAGLG